MFRVAALLRGAKKPQILRTRLGFRSISTSVKEQRLALLKEIYAPFSKLDRSSTQYVQLAKSGRVWEDYHHPSDSGALGYTSLNEEFGELLAEIDGLKQLMELRIPTLAKSLVAEYAHQSVAIEDNSLNIGDAQFIFEKLEKKLFDHIQLGSMSINEVAKLRLPQIQAIQDTSEVIEVKNHIVASQWIAENAMAKLGTPGLTQTEIQELAAISIRGTSSEIVYSHSWGGKVPLGEYRNVPVTTASHPLRIFPYPIEVAACMDRFFQWRDFQHQERSLHPLILACQMTVYFCHIHPFPDSNGRTSRMIMHDYMVRQGYLPIVMQNLERKDYLRMIDDAQVGDAREFVVSVLYTQLEELQVFHDRQHTKT